MNEETKLLLQDRYRKIQQGDQQGRRKHKEFCETIVREMVLGKRNGDDDWKQLLIGRIGPSVMNGKSWKIKYREEWKEYARIARDWWRNNNSIESLSRNNYLGFRKEFFEHCKGAHPRLIFNRLVYMMFPKQFINVPSEQQLQIVYDGLVGKGAFVDHLNHVDSMEARWFDENTVIMNVLHDALRDIKDEYYITDVGWLLVVYFKNHHG